MEERRAEDTIAHSVQYPDAHLLGLPLEILDSILDELAALSPGSLWLKETQLRITATSVPPLSLLLAHRKLHAEALRHFYEHITIVLLVDAFDAARRSPKHEIYGQFLRECSHISRVRKLELRPVLNAGIEFLEPEIQEACVVLLETAKELKHIYVGWSEVPKHLLSRWRPWAYKGKALMPLRLLRGRFTMQGFSKDVPRLLMTTGSEVDVGVGVGYSEVYAAEFLNPPPSKGIVVVEYAVDTGISSDVIPSTDLEVLANVVLAYDVCELRASMWSMRRPLKWLVDVAAKVYVELLIAVVAEEDVVGGGSVADWNSVLP
ncbi:hypothetical protein FKW77_008260 [Venturia effusa]|uniref:Uncharacterized protein n=1 Tax=Venturia effusa TaxID=50376 RepID=A0A517L9Q8_9PEZI|nr:hypothetical protein FKW77_008260 [Venturia effusa]